jgi:tetratricopeptide (TPR) repeat protein
MKKFAVLLLSLLLPGGAAAPAGAAVDPTYQNLLREGQHAFDRKDFAAAARDLRLACFGMLDEPRPLADCLARLALAQDRLEDADGFGATFQRLVEVEDRFKAYSQGDLAPELKVLLEPRVAVRIPAATLAGIPAFSALARKPAPQAPATQEKRAAPGASRRAAAPPKEAKEAAAAAAPLSDDERKALIRARLLLSEQKPDKNELEEAFKISRQVSDAHADLKEAHHIAGEAAYRLRRWSDALQYFRRGGDPGDDQPERLFYLAVTLYESGDAAGAAAAMKRALPNLQRTSYVDTYTQKILGAGGAGVQ